MPGLIFQVSAPCLTTRESTFLEKLVKGAKICKNAVDLKKKKIIIYKLIAKTWEYCKHERVLRIGI